MTLTYDSLSFRQANLSDTGFIIDAIIEAEKSGTDVLFYNSVFSIFESETRELIGQILEEEIAGQEWYIPNFVIAEIDGQKAGCLSAWIEGVTGQASGILKAQAMAYFLGKVWTQAGDKMEHLKPMQISRQMGALQLECIYTAQALRGLGVAPKLIQFVINSTENADTAEIQVLECNTKAMHSYTKCGFLTAQKASSKSALELNLLPSDTKVSLKKKIKP